MYLINMPNIYVYIYLLFFIIMYVVFYIQHV